jgi:hypothetical protein
MIRITRPVWRGRRRRPYSDDESGAWALAGVVIVIAVFAATAYTPIAPAGPASPRSHVIASRSNWCPDGRGTCAGALVAGTHRSTSFQPSLVYSVPAGWINTDDVDGGFRLVRLNGNGRGAYVETVIEIYRDPTPACPPCAAPPPTAGATVETLARWLRSHGARAVSAPTPVTIGGLAGTALTITSVPTAAGDCGHPNAAAAPLFGTAPHRSRLPPCATRTLHLLAGGAGTVVIDVTDSGGVEGVVRSLSFFPNRAPS